MKNTMKKILSLLLVVVMFLGGVCIPDAINLNTVNAAETESIAVGNVIEFGSYPQTEVTDSAYEGKTVEYNNKIFAVEPIKWRVLRIVDGNALLLTDKIIEGQPFNSTSATVDGHKANEYHYSSLRKWVTEDFFNVAFSKNEKTAIVATQLESSTDDIFILSKSEADTYAKSYFGTTATDYAYTNGVNPEWNNWWTRTAHTQPYSVYYVQYKWGSWMTYYNWYDDTLPYSMGVRPAIYIDLDAFSQLQNNVCSDGHDWDISADGNNYVCKVCGEQTTIEKGIPDDAIEFNGHYYKAYDISKSWTDAKSYCEYLGGHLATVTSQTENEFVHSMLKNGPMNLYWIGAFLENSKWQWVTTESFSYTNWELGEPSSSGDEYYVEMYSDRLGASRGGYWNDEDNDGADDSYSLSYIGFICEWDSNPFFPAGYDFYEDSFDFENYLDHIIDKKYFTTMYEESAGELFYKKMFVANGGLCFGMAYVTAAIYNGLPAATSVFKENKDGSIEYRENIRSISKKDKLYIGDLKISVDDYIKYAFVYQYSKESRSYDNLQHALFQNEMIKNDKLATVIGLHGKKDGHAVLAIGYKNLEDGRQIIYIDDPNNKDNMTTITVEADGTWEYNYREPGIQSFTSANTNIRYYVDVHEPYKILLTGERATVRPGVLDDTNSLGEMAEATFIEGMERVNADKILLYIESDSANIECEDKYEVGDVDYGVAEATEQVEDNGHFYWLNTEKTVTISDIVGCKEISLAGDNTIISANVADGSSVTMTVDAENIDAVIDADAGEYYEISFETVDDDVCDVIAKISDTASCDTITATQTETGLVVTGIADGTVTLSKDDDVIATQTFSDAISDIEITYDKTGEDENLELDYEQPEEPTDPEVPTEPDVPTDPETPDDPSDNTTDCSCLCHSKDSFLQFIYTILRFLWQLFGMNMDCACGAKHFDSYFFG